MTQEEKAKAYDEAIKRLEDIETGKCQKTFMFTEGLFNYIFPELKESGDEGIKKELIDFVKSRLAGFPQCEKFIAWLEKQGEQKPAWSEEDEEMFEHIIAKATLHFSSINYLDEEEINFLKSLRPQSTWKPSEEQIEALEKECIIHSNYELCRLLEQLKKLKENKL